MIVSALGLNRGVWSRDIESKEPSTSFNHAAGARRKRSRSPQLVQQRLRLLQIGSVEAFGEPAVDRSEEVAGFGAAALIAAQPGEAPGSAQFPELSLLLLGDAQGVTIQFLGGVGMSLPLQQLAFAPIQVCCEPALACALNDLQRIVQQSQGLFDLPCDLTCASQES